MSDRSSHVFVSYASADRNRVTPVVAALERAGISVWLDRSGIAGGANYGPEIVAAIRESGALLLCCSAAAFASRNVRQEVALAWKHERPILPLLLEHAGIPDELAYWLEAAQWIEVLERPEAEWLPEVARALGKLGIASSEPVSPPTARHAPAALLPSPLTDLLGREAELAGLGTLLDGHRLVTLTGPGGVGKTRLAIEAARRAAPSFPDGAAFVDLSPLREASLVLPTIARAIGVVAADTLAMAIGERRMLLLLDNLEQVLDAAPEIAALLSRCPRLVVLATSRAPLGVRGERIVPLDPLPVPDPAAESSVMAGSPAVTLFIERAREARPGFAPDDVATIARICRRLDGMPLAIELAAARTRVLTPPALLARLEQVLPALSGGPRDLPARQRTLRDAIAWSHDLLSSEDQTLFRRLGVFVGGCSLEAAEEVVNHDGALDMVAGLGSLVDNSLLRERVVAGVPRCEMFETIREFALERLAESGETDILREMHADFYGALAERAEPELHGAHQQLWGDRLEADRANVRATLEWFAARRNADRMLATTSALAMFWIMRGPLPEARTWMERALASNARKGRAHGLAYGALIVWHQGDVAQAAKWAEQGLVLAGASGDQAAAGQALYVMCLNAMMEGDLDRATQHGERAVERLRAFDTLWLPYALCDLGFVLGQKGAIERGASLAEEGRALHRQRGNRFGIGVSASDWGLIAEQSGDIDGAANQYRESVRQFGMLGDLWYLSSPLAGLGSIAAHRGEFERTVRLLAAAERLHEVSGSAVMATEHARDVAAVEKARVALGEARFAAAWSAGRALSLEEIIAEALAGAQRI